MVNFSSPPVAYIVTADTIIKQEATRSWHVFWAKHPNLAEHLNPYKYRYDKNVTITPYYDVKEFPRPALQPLTFQYPDCNEYHCFRTYKINNGKIEVIYKEDGTIA